MKVLVAGDANLDLVLRGDVVPRFGQAEQLLDSADLVLGSSAGICASGLARLGPDVALVARVGADVFGDQTLRLLAANGVETAAILRGGEPTGVSVILSGVDDRAILTLTGAMTGLTAADVRSATFPEPGEGPGRIGRIGHLHVASYFLLPGLAEGLPALLAEARERGVTTSLDTNWDPAQAWAGVAECLPHLDVFLPNAAEALAIARALGGEPGDAESAARLLAGHGPVVAVKVGAAGGFAVAGDLLVRAPGLAMDVVDTTGAGDSFDAGFLAAWLSGLDLATAVRWGTTAGSLSTRGAGGTGGQPTRAELEDALARV
ncbi:MAG TPA: carbohydrate kinase family protein [Propionicimonas sp.]|nr:carbohydrate kinase family protein [Propionicimonas sp.]